MYRVSKVSPFHVRSLLAVIGILHRCGKNMATQQNLQHWNNSVLKNAVILVLCLLKKNTIYLVLDVENRPVATFQTRRCGTDLRFQKLATEPAYAGRGIGSFCMEQIEGEAKNIGCQRVCMEVYDKSLHAIHFYEKRGYTICGTVNTLKYTELTMEKQLKVIR